MPMLRMVMEGDGAFPELKPIRERGDLYEVDTFTVTALPGGMVSGAPSIGLVIQLPDGKAVFAQTSMALFLNAADAFKAKYGDPRSVDIIVEPK